MSPIQIVNSYSLAYRHRELNKLFRPTMSADRLKIETIKPDVRDEVIGQGHTKNEVKQANLSLLLG